MAEVLEVLEIEGAIGIALERALENGPEALKARAQLTELSRQLAALVDERELAETFHRIVQLNPPLARDRHAVLQRAWTMIDRQREDREYDVQIGPDIAQRVDILLKLILSGESVEASRSKVVELGRQLSHEIGASKLDAAIARIVALEPKHADARRDILAQAWHGIV